MEAISLENPAGGRAILIRTEDGPRVLVKIRTRGKTKARVTVVPLDAGVEVSRERDALAAFIAAGTIVPAGEASRVPRWANAMGYVLIFLVVGFTLLGSLTFFGWLFGAIGLTR